MSVADLESLTVAERKDIPLEDFAWPSERKFPVDTQDHLDSLATLIGTAPEAEQPKIKARAKAIATRHGFTLPKSWQDEEKGETEAWNRKARGGMSESASVRPAKKIATLPICWLEYNARSLNGRIYPKATCDALYKAAQRKLADCNVDPPLTEPPTTFVSHEAANGNVNTELVGAPVKVWQEGSKFWANLDMADTSVARDIVGLVEGKYLRSGSMRVLGVELVHDRNYDLPLVVCLEGIEPTFLGIDLATRPGFTGVARIPQVLYESDGRAPYIDAFTFTDVSVESKEEAAMASIPLYLSVLLESTPLGDAKSAHKRIHDHLAGVLDATVKAVHGNESAALMAAVESELTEDGRAIAQKHAVKLAAAHDESAKQSGMVCEGAYNQALNIPDDPSELDNDGDNTAATNGESQKGHTSMDMTEEQMIEALKKKGFSIETPKTSEQLLQESFDAKLAEQARTFEERLAALTGTTDPQRQTLALSNQTEESAFKPEELYEDGDYLKADLAPKNWRALANRRVPWPHDKLDPKTVLKEMAPFLAYRLNLEEAHARGRDISQFIESHEQV